MVIFAVHGHEGDNGVTLKEKFQVDANLVTTFVRLLRGSDDFDNFYC